MMKDAPSPEPPFMIRDDVTAYRHAPSAARGAAAAGMLWASASLH